MRAPDELLELLDEPPPDERLLLAEERELPPDDRLLPTDEREPPLEDRLLPADDREPPDGVLRLPPYDRLLPIERDRGADDPLGLLRTELGERTL